MSETLRCKIAGLGAWGSHFEHWQDLQTAFATSDYPIEKLKGPKPEIIPANERRRAPVPVRLAVTSSWQACQAAKMEPSELNCVFVSGLGDTDLTDYMCKVLASEHKELSPTKFHNSVHNAPAGYWTISTESMGSANSVAGFEYSVPLTIMEAMIQCQYENKAILITCYDAPVCQVLSPLLENTEPFSFSIIIAPENSDITGLTLNATINKQVTGQWPTLVTGNVGLQRLYQTNPSAKILALAELMAGDSVQQHSITLPLSPATSLSLSLEES